MIQAIIDLQDKIQREGTIRGNEFETAQRQATKRVLVELAPGRNAAPAIAGRDTLSEISLGRFQAGLFLEAW